LRSGADVPQAGLHQTIWCIDPDSGCLTFVPVMQPTHLWHRNDAPGISGQEMLVGLIPPPPCIVVE
jgi:hypothetical protein